MKEFRGNLVPVNLAPLRLLYKDAFIRFLLVILPYINLLSQLLQF